MRVGYIKQAKSPFRIIDRIKYFLGIIDVYEYEQGCVFQVPVYQKEKKMNNMLKHIQKKLHQYKIDNTVLSNEWKNHIFYHKLNLMFQKENISVLEGKKLMHYMNYDILQYILNMQKTTMEQEEVSFLIQKDNHLDLQFLSKFVENCKMVNIVTNDVSRFKSIQENLYEKENILISVSNHKNKALKRAKYILNVNMCKKELEKYKINRQAILINFAEDIIYNKLAFEGICINYFQICIPDEYLEKFENMDLIDEFDTAKLYEAILLQKIDTIKKSVTMMSKNELNKHKNMITDIIKEDEIYITGLVGKNGIICKQEYLDLTKSEK